MKRIIFSLSLLLFMPGMYGQTGHITLEECQQKTQDNYPLVRQYDLVEKTKEYNLENAERGLPFRVRPVGRVRLRNCLYRFPE